MADANLGYQEPDTIDKLLDAESLTVGADTVYRERIQISGTAAADIAPVSATDGLLVNLGANNDVTVAGVSTAANQTTIIGHLDGVEGLLTTIDADTGSILLAVDGLEALLTTIDTDTGSILSAVDGIEALLTTIDADTSNIATSVANIDTDTTTIIGHLDGVEGLLTTIDADTGGILTSVQLIDNAATTIGTTDVLRVALFDNANNQVTSFGGGTQYTQGDTDASITGTAMMMEGAADTLLPVQGTVADGLLVNLGANNDVTVTGTVDLGATDNAVLDAIAASVAAIDTDATTIIGHVDGIEGLLTTIDADTSGIATSVDGIEALLTTIDADTSNLSVVGGGTEAAAIRVTIANNSTGVLSVDDNGSTLSIDDGGGVITVDGSVTVSATNLDIRDIDAATDDITIHGDVGIIDQFDLTNSNPAAVAIVDGNGDQITSFGGGTQYAVDAALGANPTGTLTLFKRDDALSALTPAEGDAVEGRVDANGAIHMNMSYKLDSTNDSVTAVASGSVAHDAADSGNPVKIGAKAVAHGSNPTAVAAGDRTDLYANRHGIPFFIGGHPNIQLIQANYTDADGAQTNAAIISASAGTKIVVTHITVACDNANTGDVQCRIGFGTASTPANDAAKVLLSHPGIAPGSGVGVGNGGGILGIGADDEDLRITCEDPAGGAIDVVVGYYTIES